jgi:hypothetical protein
MKRLASKHNFTTGKWLIPVPWSEADEVWRKLVLALMEGQFADDLGVLFIKVHGRSDPETNPHNLVQGEVQSNAMILVGTQDWTSEEKTMEVAKVIRSLGITQELKYKPDFYSNLKIYQFNLVNLRPSIYYCL